MSLQDSGGGGGSGGSATLNQNPLITVSGGEVADFILANSNGLAGQLSADLGRESVEWHRSFDQPLTVYLEATFVRLDVDRHLLADQQQQQHQIVGKQQLSTGHSRQLSSGTAHSYLPSSSQQLSSSTGLVAGHHPVLGGVSGTSSASSVKRNHSFNVIRRTDSSALGRSAGDSANLGTTTTTVGPNSSESSFVSGHHPGTLSPEQENQVNHGLVRLLASRFHATNGAPVLLQSYWVDHYAQLDLESYHSVVRQPLLDWFSRILANAGANARLGMTPSTVSSIGSGDQAAINNNNSSSSFLLDCAIVVVINRQRIVDLKKSAGGGGSTSEIGKPNTNNSNNNGEQVLSLDRLIADQKQLKQQQQQLINRTPTKTASSSLFKTSFGLGSSSKKLSGKSAQNSSNSSSNLTSSHPLSSSLTSLSSSNPQQQLHSANSQNPMPPPPPLPLPVHLTVSGLIEQMRNDLSVCYQLFQQKILSEGSSGGGGNFYSFTPPHPATIVAQLMERVLIFDYASNASNSSVLGGGTDGNFGPQMPSLATGAGGGGGSTGGSTSSTMKQISSALSSSFGGSIKIMQTSSSSSVSNSSTANQSSSASTTSMLMSPSRSLSGKSRGNLLHHPPALDPASLPVLTYSALVAKFRSLLLEGNARQVGALERQIRRQRELRNSDDWDFFGFFLLQEQLALLYESLGLYGRALVQYDELDALFSQSIANTGASGGIGPRWLQRRLLGHQEDDDDDEYDGGDDFEVHHPSLTLSGGGGDHHHSSLYSAWNGLCLCNPAAINGLRGKIVNCVLADAAVFRFAEKLAQTEVDRAAANSSSPTSPSFLRGVSATSSSHGGPQSLTGSEGFGSQASPSSASSQAFIFSDPLGVNLGVGGGGGGGGHPNRQLSHRGSPLKNVTLSSGVHPLMSLNSTSSSSPLAGCISLIDFRNYLFARQCHLLCLLNKPWELASRALPFLQTTVAELKMLEISIAPGGIACWVFLSVLEILHKCERYSDSSQLESYSYHTVGLWAYARDKLAELGTLCSLMPDGEHHSEDVRLLKSTKSAVRITSSEQLHRMVELVAGMGADPHIRVGGGGGGGTESSSMSPQERLKSALSSGPDFLAHYLEITELTMGTYKHIGYIRSARLIGAQLARLYLQLGRPQQALPFLLDHYNLFTAERWSALKAETARLLARCLEALYYSAYKKGGGKSNGEEEEEEDAQPAFNLEATARSAFRTYLLLLLKPTTLAQKQKICAGLGSSSKQMTSLGRPSKFSSTAAAADVNHQQQQQEQQLQQQQQLLYLNSLKKLLLTYTKNGLLLREIVEKLVHSLEQSDQSSSGSHQGGDSHQKTTTAANLFSGRQKSGHPSISSHYLDYSRPLLAIHNSHSDLFYDSYTSTSASSAGSSSSSSSTLANSSSSLHRVPSNASATILGGNHRPATATSSGPQSLNDHFLSASPPPPPPPPPPPLATISTASSHLAAPSSSSPPAQSGGGGGGGGHPPLSPSPSKPLNHSGSGPQLRKLGERFFRVTSLEITTTTTSSSSTSTSNTKSQNGQNSEVPLHSSSSSSSSSSRSDRSFIAGSRLQMKLVVQSELAVEVPLEHLLVTVEARSSSAPPSAVLGVPGAVQPPTRKRSTASMSSLGGGSSSSTEQLDAIETAIRLSAVHQEVHSLGTSSKFGTDSKYSSETGVPLPPPQPYSIMEAYYHHSGGEVTGVACRNVEYLLNYSGGGGGNFFGGGGPGLKFLSQLPVSLLNQRLADDQNNFRHYRFLAANYRFDHLKVVTKEEEKEETKGGDSDVDHHHQKSTAEQSLVLKPGVNTFYLTFQSPEQFAGHKETGHQSSKPKANLQQSMSKMSSSATPVSPVSVNQLWFSLDQLVLFCRFNEAKTDDSKHQSGGHNSSKQSPSSSSPSSSSSLPTFAIVEDFNSQSHHAQTQPNSAVIAATSTPPHLATNFRLVKCPPTVELVPIKAEVQSGTKEGSSKGGVVASSLPYTSLLIGIDTPVTLRLNSGTNVLPKGLKCFIKIAPVMPPVQSALFHHHHHQNDHLYHPHPHPQLNSSVTDLKSMSTTVPLPPSPQNTLPNYDSRLLTVTLHAPKKSASEVSSETKSDVVGDDDDDQNDDSLLYFHLDRQIEPFGTYELTLVLKSAYSRAQVCSINQWAVSSSASSALNFFSGPSSAASLNLNSKPSSNSRDYQLTVSWTASQVSASDQQTSSSSSSVSTSTSMMTMMMMAANCTFTLYAPFHLFTKLHSVGGAGRKLLEVGLLGATDLINSGGRAVVVRRPELSHHAQHQKMMAKLAVTTLNVAQSDHHVDLGPLGPLPSNLSKKVPSTSVSNIHFKPIHSGRSDQQNSTYPLKANTEQHFLWEFESGGDNDLRTAPLSLANLKRFNLELSFAEAPKSDDDKVPNWKTATFEVRLSTDLSTRYTVREHIEPMAAHHHFSSATLNSNQSSHNTNINNSGKNMSTELLRVGSSCLLRVTIEKVVVVAVKTTNQSETLAATDDLEDNNSAEEEEEEEEDNEQIMYELVYDADLWSMVVNSSTNSGGGGGGNHPPPYPQQPNHPLHHHHPHPHLKHRRNLSSTETTGTLSSLASSTGSAAQPESLGSLSSMTTLTSTNTNTNFSSGYYSLQGTAPCSEQQNKFTSLQQESTTTTANSLSSSSAAVAAAFNVHSKVLRLSSAEPTFEALFEMTPLADGYLPYPSVRLSRYVEQGKSSGPGGGEHARWQTPNFAPRSASPTPKGGSVESVIHGGGGGSSGSNGSGDNLDGTGASKSGTAAVEPLTTTSSGPLSLSVKNWTAKLLSSSSSLTPSKSSSSHHQYQSLSTGKASSTEQLHQIGNDHHQAGVSSKATPISGKLIAFEPGQVYNYSRAAQIYVLPAAIAAVESSASDSAHSTTMTTQTAHTSSSSSSSSAAAATALSGPMTAVSVDSG